MLKHKNKVVCLCVNKKDDHTFPPSSVEHLQVVHRHLQDFCLF